MNGPVVVAALLLVWAGAAKLVRPGATGRALGVAGLPASPTLVRGVAAVEIVVGVLAVAPGGRAVDAAVAASFGAFAAFVGLALSRGWPLASCGCFGEADALPSRTHVATTAVLAATAALAALGDAPVRPLAALHRHPGPGAALWAASVVTAGLVVVTLTRLPQLHAQRRHVR